MTKPAETKQAIPSPEDRVRAMTAEELLDTYTDTTQFDPTNSESHWVDEAVAMRAELLSRLSLVEELIPFCDSPCGHSSQYAYSGDGGKNIVCLICEREELKGQVASASPQPMCPKCRSEAKVISSDERWDGQIVVECQKPPSPPPYWMVTRFETLVRMVDRGTQDTSALEEYLELRKKLRELAAPSVAGTQPVARCPKCGEEMQGGFFRVSTNSTSAIKWRCKGNDESFHEFIINCEEKLRQFFPGTSQGTPQVEGTPEPPKVEEFVQTFLSRLAGLTEEQSSNVAETLSHMLRPYFPPASQTTKWKCFHCFFETSDYAKAEAHFGDGEGDSAICLYWSKLSIQERLQEFQDLIQQLNGERDEGAVLLARAEKAEKELATLATPASTARTDGWPDLLYGDHEAWCGKYTRNGESNSGGNIGSWYAHAVFWRNRAEGILNPGELPAAPGSIPQAPDKRDDLRSALESLAKDYKEEVRNAETSFAYMNAMEVLGVPQAEPK